MKVLKLTFVIAVAVLAMPVQAAIVTMNASDTLGQASFNSAGHWNNAAAPSAGNDYFSGDFVLRTPPNSSSHTFAGDSLTINNTGPYSQGLLYKGTGNTGIITINNLILGGGYVSHANGINDVFQLDGNINVATNSTMYPKQGPINVLADISGSANVTVFGSDGSGRILRWMSPSNTFSGSLINNGRFELVDDAVMKFVIGASGVNNAISGTGAETILGGDFVLDLSGAGTNLGDSWSLVTATNKTYGSTFNMAGFADLGGGLWKNGGYVFDTATGVLTYTIPEPASLALAGIAMIAATARRRK